MNIENHFNNAEVCLKMAKEDFAIQDYDRALSSLGNLYSHVTSLMNKVSVLHRLKPKVSTSAGEDGT